MPGTTATTFALRMTCRTGAALLPRLMGTCTGRSFRILLVKVERLPGRTDPAVHVLLQLESTGDARRLTSELFPDDGVLEIETTAAADDE
ncbi:hypothetical protein ACFZDJ_41205 [Streptomyces sp. NPDC007896]|uniref:hypothetical protein n=1 Tax=Streptomyces sp. NPDC007896 TaxID=3364784 RepID=UPI0036F157DC